MGSTIRTFSGKQVDPTNLSLDDICIEDIAHHLSLLCRYIGACPDFYSIAQHSVIVAIRMHIVFGTKEAGRAGLFHDGSEAYMHDIPSPIKRMDGMSGYRDAENKATNTIFEKFNIVDATYWHPYIKPFDHQVYLDEVESWWGTKKLIIPCSPKDAEKAFLAAYRNFS